MLSVWLAYACAPYQVLLLVLVLYSGTPSFPSSPRCPSMDLFTMYPSSTVDDTHY
jgi:hypothetical protein